MFPKTPEIVVIVIISIAIFGLSNLEDLGEFVWRLRVKWSPSLEAPAGAGDSGEVETNDDSNTE